MLLDEQRGASLLAAGKPAPTSPSLAALGLRVWAHTTTSSNNVHADVGVGECSASTVMCLLVASVAKQGSQS